MYSILEKKEELRQTENRKQKEKSQKQEVSSIHTMVTQLAKTCLIFLIYIILLGVNKKNVLRLNLKNIIVHLAIRVSYGAVL